MHQNQVYNGWKHAHGLKFQSIVAPDGILLHLDGPYLGRHHDAWVLQVSGLLEILDVQLQKGEKSYCIYGDPAYSVGRRLHTYFNSIDK